MNNQESSADCSQSIENQTVGIQGQSPRTATHFDSKGVFLSYRAVAIISILALVTSIAALVVAITNVKMKPCEMTFHKEKVFNSEVEEIERRYIIAGWKVESKIPTPAGAMVEFTFSRCK